MVASNRTTQKVVEIARRHMDDESLGRMLQEMRSVGGNGSFRDTISRLVDEHARVRTTPRPFGSSRR